ncbi:MAG: histidine kinase dimerization/phospho-acceptor domain-containing protein, partial [Leeuwenhoekiella sp.]
MQNEVEEELYSRRYRLEHYLELNQTLIELPPVFEIHKAQDVQTETLKDTLIYDPSQDETELFRELTSYMNVNGENYQIIVRSMVVETEDIILVIFLSFFAIILLIFCIQFYFSRAWNKILWKPFFNNLEQMKTFSIKSEERLQLEESEIIEFSDLKDEIVGLTDKVAADYKNLKQFTEDISHELQTPLAIMQAKIDNLLNDTSIDESHFEQFSSLQKDIHRLAKLNKKLVLLTKLENQQFVRVTELDFNQLVSETVENFKELTSLSIDCKLDSQITLMADSELIQILCNNLIS